MKLERIIKTIAGRALNIDPRKKRNKEILIRNRNLEKRGTRE